MRALVANGTTVLLTTQYLDEADQLAARIAVIDHGRVIAEGTPGELKASVGAGALHVRVADPDQRETAMNVLSRALGIPVMPESDPAAMTARLDDLTVAARALPALNTAQIAVTSFALGRPSLDEVFLALTGRPTADDTEPSTR